MLSLTLLKTVRLASLLVVGVTALVWVSGCKPKTAGTTDASGKNSVTGLTSVSILMDWYPQAEHGGFYQALAKGFYKEAGLDVTIIPGAPGPTVEQKLIGGVANLSLARSDDLISHAAQGLPLLFIGVFMERDPQAILLHEESPVSRFEDLNGKTIMAVPGTNWISYLQAHYHISLNLIPSNFGIAQFMADKNFIQQCFITNEPYFVRKNGAKPKTLLLANSGYRPYRGIMTTTSYAKAHPDVLRAFIAASLRGWDDFMNGDPTPAKAAIAAANKTMTEEFMDFSINSMREYKLISGEPTEGESLGRMSRKRLAEQMDLLVQLKIIPKPISLEKIVSFDYLPPELQKLSD